MAVARRHGRRYSAVMDFRDLRTELLDEYYFWADKPSDVFYKFQPYYWMARGQAYAAVATNLPGSKYLVSANSPAGLTDEIRKALLFADHVVIRLERDFVPHKARVFVNRKFRWPGSDELAWVTTNRAEASGSPLLPCEPGSPDAETARNFLDWTLGEGRPWIESGLVTYVPCVIPREASVALLAQGTNVVAAYRRLGVLPDDGRALNEKSAAAITELQLPYLSGVTPAMLRELMAEHPNAVGRLRQALFRMLNSIKEDVGTDEFSRQVDLVSQDVASATADLEGKLRTLSTSTRWERVDVELLALGASTLWYSGSTTAALITALTATALAGAKAARERFKGAASLKDDPYFAVARLGHIRARTQAAERPRLVVTTPPRPEDSDAVQPELVLEEWGSPDVPPDPPPSWGSIEGDGLEEQVWMLCVPAYPPTDSGNILANWERAREAQQQLREGATGPDDPTDPG